MQELDPGVRFAACSGLPRQQWKIKDRQVKIIKMVNATTLFKICQNVTSVMFTFPRLFTP